MPGYMVFTEVPSASVSAGRYHFGITALENVTQNEWDVFLAVSLGSEDDLKNMSQYHQNLLKTRKRGFK